MLNTIECVIESDVSKTLTEEIVARLKEFLAKELDVLRQEVSRHRTKHRFYVFFEKIEIRARSKDENRVAYIHYWLQSVFFHGEEENSVQAMTFSESHHEPIGPYCDQEHALTGVYVGLTQKLEHVYHVLEPDD